ncbi:MAG: hypothetical protein AAF449_12745 [Myxococcota bacterium]
MRTLLWIAAGMATIGLVAALAGSIETPSPRDEAIDGEAPLTIENSRPSPAPNDARVSAALGRGATKPVALAGRLEKEEEETRRWLMTVDPGMPLGTQADTFVSRLIEISDADPTQPEGRLYRARATEVFLRIPEVQAQLQALSPSARKEGLAAIRRSFGHTPQEIARLQATDAYKEARWSNGLEYMKLRQQLVDEHPEGDALESALSNLRTRFFSHEAVTIAKEEDMGFFRYNRTRILGRN